jgi:hypothetical protein
MIGRRAVVLAGAALAVRPAVAVAALPVPSGDSLAFVLIRHGSQIGRHTLRFDRQGDTLTVAIDVQALVTVLSIPFVRYTHHAVETWQGDTLVGLVADTDKNGQHEWTKASRTGEGLVVLGSKTKRYVAPAEAIGTSYWNRRMLDGPMISLEDGVLLAPKVLPRQPESVRLASGASIPADHYSLSGAFSADVWYDRAGTWAGFAFGVADGSSVHYERL